MMRQSFTTQGRAPFIAAGTIEITARRPRECGLETEGEVTLDVSGNDDPNARHVMSPCEAESLGRALLAAAQHARE